MMATTTSISMSVKPREVLECEAERGVGIAWLMVNDWGIITSRKMTAAEWRREGCFLIWTRLVWKGSILVGWRNTVDKTLGQKLCFRRFGRAWAFEWQTRTSETRSEGRRGAVSRF